MGWEHVTGRFSKPQFDGVVVAAENFQLVVDAWTQDCERKATQHAEKRETRCVANWLRLIQAARLHRKVSTTYETKAITSQSSPVVAPGAAQSAQGPHEHVFPKSMWQHVSAEKWLKVCQCGFSVTFEQM